MAETKKLNKKAKKKSAEKKSTLKVTPKVEKVADAPKPEVQSYVGPISFSRAPVDKDIPVADLFYHTAANSFSLQCYAPQHEAAVEDIVAGDISMEDSGNIKMVSKVENPISWVINLKNSKEFSGKPFLAGEAQEIYEA